jgi:hypothetical protein
MQEGEAAGMMECVDIRAVISRCSVVSVRQLLNHMRTIRRTEGWGPGSTCTQEAGGHVCFAVHA